MGELIEPRTLKGFRDYPPELMIPREQLLEKVRHVYRSYGFAPIDTPALEYSEILLGKGGAESDRQLYRFAHDRHDIALRFDLTVPFARFAARHIAELGTPFKRYHLGPVWRGDTQRGRFREFWQCDFDTIGTTSNAADIEAALVIHDMMLALGFERFQVRVNNRLVLNGLLEELGLAAQAVPVLRALDKLPKIKREATALEMTGIPGVSAAQAERILALAETRGSNEEVLQRLQGDFGANPKAAEGIARLRELCAAVRTAGVPDERLCLDLAIARGLDYYTGTIYETFLGDDPNIGSVCSGGRYDNLAEKFTKQKLPGVGASLGLDRLLAAMEELHLLPKVGTPAPVFIVQFSPERVGEYQKMARLLRGEGIGVEVYPDARKLGPQFEYAGKRGFRLALIAGPDEFAKDTWNIRDMASRAETKDVPASALVATVKKLLGYIMDRSNHYERAFEAYLQRSQLCYVAVDETRRSVLGGAPLKSLDFIVHGNQEAGSRLLIDIKGRRFPTGAPGRERKVWECWSTQEDIAGLERWGELFGPGYQGLLVFTYRLAEDVELPADTDDLWNWRGQRYLFRAVPVAAYARHMRVRSPRWGTVTLPRAAFRRLVRPFSHFIQSPAAVVEDRVAEVLAPF